MGHRHHSRIKSAGSHTYIRKRFRFKPQQKWEQEFFPWLLSLIFRIDFILRENTDHFRSLRFLFCQLSDPTRLTPSCQVTQQNYNTHCYAQLGITCAFLNSHDRRGRCPLTCQRVYPMNLRAVGRLATLRNWNALMGKMDVGQGKTTTSYQFSGMTTLTVTGCLRIQLWKDRS